MLLRIVNQKLRLKINGWGCFFSGQFKNNDRLVSWYVMWSIGGYGILESLHCMDHQHGVRAWNSDLGWQHGFIMIGHPRALEDCLQRRGYIK